MAAEFVHLHLHTQFSFLVGTVRIAELAPKVKELGMRAVAMTDHANMFGAIRHWNACKKAEIQPILGCELNIAREPNGKKVDHLVCLAATNEGYANLVKLVSKSNMASVTEAAPAVTLDDVAAHAKGIVALTACMNGVVSQQVLERGPDQATPWLGKLRDLFEPGHLFVELQNHELPEQPVLNEILYDAAMGLGLPIVGTNDVHFVGRDDGEAHLYLECVRKNRLVEEERPHHHGSFEMYLKTPEEMADAFRGYPEALANTLRVAEMCSGVKLALGTPMLPTFPVPPEHTVDSYFEHVAREGLERRFQQARAAGQPVDEEAYRQRLVFEVGVIVKMKYPGYFLIVWDFIREAKARGIPVGPGRGSGAGSIVAYAMGITNLDPIPFNLLFERFLNPERVSMPDFDVDFCMDRRERVIDYVAEKYGRASVGQIATFQNLKARSVIKDVARTMAFPAPEAAAIANQVRDLGQGKTQTIAEALADKENSKLGEMVAKDERVATLVEQARKLEGLTRHAGMHAAGVVISDGPLDDYVPTFPSDVGAVTQYDKDDVELAGLVKFDFLGLKTLTTIDIAEKLVNARPDRRNKRFSVEDLPLTDAPTFTLIGSGETKNVFQLESDGMQRTVLRPLKPDCFEDIVAAVALYRPGPLSTGMVQDFIDCKHGKKQIRKLHPLIDPVLAPTYGVPVYQEQVMQIAQGLAGYTLGGADLLRRAMGKKKASEMEKQAKTFVEGALKNGVPEEQSMAIFREIEGFASYGFNKSHSAAYALLTYHTAYLKTHYPAEFFAAVMTSDKDKTEKVIRTINESRGWGVSVLPPDVNLSDIDFTVVYAHPDGRGPAKGPGKLADRFAPQIRFGLGAVRGLGESALEAVFDARKAGGPFTDLFDFAARVDGKRLNRGVIEALVQCGAFDTVLAPRGISRARAFAAIDRVLERAKSASRDRESGQATLFGLFAAAAPAGQARLDDDYPTEWAEWDRLELLRREKEALGCFVSGHPLDRYGAKLGRLGALTTADVFGVAPWTAVTVTGVVEAYNVRVFRSGGGKAAFFELEDRTGRLKAKLRADRIDRFTHLLTGSEPVLVSGKASFPRPAGDDDAEPDGPVEPTLLVDSVELLSDAVLRATKSVTLRFDAARTAAPGMAKLRRLIDASPGSCPVELALKLPGQAEVTLVLEQRRVTPGDAFLAGLERTFGDAVVAELR